MSLRPNMIERGCPRDHGDITFDLADGLYHCGTCDYSRQGTHTPATDLVVMKPADANGHPETYTVAELETRWSLTEAGVKRRLEIRGGISKVYRMDPIPAKAVERVESYLAGRGAKPNHGGWQTRRDGHAVAVPSRSIAPTPTPQPIEVRAMTFAAPDRADRLRLALEHIEKVTATADGGGSDILAVQALVGYALAVDDLGAG